MHGRKWLEACSQEGAVLRSMVCCGVAETWEGKLAHRVVRWSMRQTKKLHLYGLDTRVRSLERARLHAGRLVRRLAQ